MTVASVSGHLMGIGRGSPIRMTMSVTFVNLRHCNPLIWTRQGRRQTSKSSRSAGVAAKETRPARRRVPALSNARNPAHPCAMRPSPPPPPSKLTLRAACSGWWTRPPKTRWGHVRHVAPARRRNGLVPAHPMRRQTDVGPSIHSAPIIRMGLPRPCGVHVARELARHAWCRNDRNRRKGHPAPAFVHLDGDSIRLAGRRQTKRKSTISPASSAA